jgi:predicted nucleic acid-binding protein
MPEYVVDATLVIQHFISDAYTVNADALFDELGRSITLYVPEFCLLECGNVLWKRVRFHGLPLTQAQRMVVDLVGLPLIIVPTAGVLGRGLQIGLTHQLAVYDSVYIALAEQLGYPLITADTKQETAAQVVGVATKPITDFTLKPK